MEKLEREGQFRAKITSYELTEAQSQAVGVRLKAVVTQEPGAVGWVDCETMEVSGTIWIGKKDGFLNEPACMSLMEHAGWDGNIESIGNKGWEPKPCSITVKAEEYNNEIQYRLSFINGYESVPKMSATRAKELQQKFAAQLLRLGGAVSTAAPIKPSPLNDDSIPF